MSLAVVVSDTSPLNYLVLIQSAELLPRLFSKVIIPPAVREELTRNETPEAVRNWMARPPAWLEVVVPRSRPHEMDLDEGESEAIALALELGITSILIDERKGFRVAESFGLAPIGMLAVLELCASTGWTDFEECIRLLRGTTFRIPERLVSEISQRLRQGT